MRCNRYFELLQKVYNTLGDAISQRIFEHRLLYSVTNDISHIFNMVCNLGNVRNKRSLQAILDAKDAQDGIVLFGAGAVGRTALNALTKAGIPVSCFCDNDPSKCNLSFHGLPVISTDQLLTDYRDKNVIVTTPMYSDEICRQLSNLGFPEDQVVACIDLQYFEQFLPLTPKEIFVDAGSLNAATSLDFINWCGDNFSRLYVFEPDSQNMSLCKANLGHLAKEKIEYVEAALWSSSGSLNFKSTHNGSSLVTDESDSIISSVTLDNVLNGERASFIKMDVEGAELEALIGARHTIQTHRPKLAVSLYHKLEDILQIPTFICELVPDYSLYLRHYTLFETETVLYAVPKS